MELACGRYQGKVVRLDPQKRWVYVDADLPDDGRLDLHLVTFGNPGCVNNSVYTIHSVRKDGSTSVLDLGPQRLDLGRAVVAGVDTKNKIIQSLVPHDYARGLTRQGTRFFEGKRLTAANGEASTTITRTEHGAPFLIHVRSTQGFREGQELHYMDLQVGDTFSINNWAAATKEAGRWQIAGTGEVALQSEDQ